MTMYMLTTDHFNFSFFRINSMKAKLQKFEDHIELDRDVANDIHDLMKSNSDDFFRLFYSEQVKLQSMHKNGRRFHPDIVRYFITSFG